MNAAVAGRFISRLVSLGAWTMLSLLILTAILQLLSPARGWQSETWPANPICRRAPS
jgi:hypothetical protein